MTVLKIQRQDSHNKSLKALLIGIRDLLANLVRVMALHLLNLNSKWIIIREIALETSRYNAIGTHLLGELKKIPFSLSMK
jgi:hypothetical protein